MPQRVRFEVFGVEILAANLSDILRSKQAADRPQDRHDAILLRALIEARESGEPYPLD